MEFAGHCTCVCALDAVRNIQGASRWAAKAHSQEWLCHGTPENCPWLLLPVRGNQPSPSLRDSRSFVWALYPALRAGLKSSASLWDLRGANSGSVVPPGLIVPAYARCGRGEEHSGGFHVGGKGAQPGMGVLRSGVGG